MDDDDGGDDTDHSSPCDEDALDNDDDDIIISYQEFIPGLLGDDDCQIRRSTKIVPLAIFVKGRRRKRSSHTIVMANTIQRMDRIAMKNAPSKSSMQNNAALVLDLQFRTKNVRRKADDWRHVITLAETSS